MSSRPEIPSQEELASALAELRTQNTPLGIPKLHALLLSVHDNWSVSEKRTRKVLQSLYGASNSAQSKTKTKGAVKSQDGHAYPISRVVEGLDVAQWTKKVTVEYFGPQKGKGLVAASPIQEGEVIWKEDPFVFYPEPDIYDLQRRSLACAHCATPLTSIPNPLTCPSTTGTTSHPCTARFCNRLCLTRASSHIHPLLCPSTNPASTPLLAFARQHEWGALGLCVRLTARLLLSNEERDGGERLRSEWTFVSALAGKGMEGRVGDFDDSSPVDASQTLWRESHKLLLQAFREPPSDAAKKKIHKVLKKGRLEKVKLPTGEEEDLEEEVLSYDGFLRMLGRCSLNQESHGGLYTLHSHLNHACDPNVSVRHLDQRTHLARITLIAKREIKEGEEMTVTYVDPCLPIIARRRQLKGWGFGTCQCERCVKEEAEMKEKGLWKEEERQEAAAKNGGGVDDELVQELKAGFGVE